MSRGSFSDVNVHVILQCVAFPMSTPIALINADAPYVVAYIEARNNVALRTAGILPRIRRCWLLARFVHRDRGCWLGNRGCSADVTPPNWKVNDRNGSRWPRDMR